MAAAAGPDAAGGTPSAVELRGITKRFPGVVANKDIELRVARGEVHAIVGENGAGKSTLMKTLYGEHRPDEGTILLDGREVSFRSPADAIAAGIGMVHQHFMLADNFTVLENIVLGSEPTKGGRLDRAEARRRILEISDRYGLGLRPDVLVEDLGVGDRQRVEIAKVLYRDARILILDEPTAVLVPQEVDELFGNLAELKREGLTVLFISHKLDEVRKVADSITVIRRGTTVGTADPRTTTTRQLAELMVGAELPSPETRTSTVRETPVLQLNGVTVHGVEGRALVEDATLTVREGEVVGIAGVEGNGQAELVEAIMGLRHLVAGTVLLGADDITAWSTRARREAGLGFIPEDRHRQGMLLDGTLWENRILGHQTRPPAVKGLLHRPQERPRGHRTDHARVRRPGPRPGRPRHRPLRRQSAEADRRPGDERRAAAADRRPPHPRCRRRRAGGDLGAAQGRPGRGHGHPADLGGPRRADRAVGHPAGHAPRAAGGHPRPGCLHA